MQINTPSQKINIDFKNLCAGNWSLWKDCAQKSALYQVSNPILERLKIDKGLIQ